MTIPLLPSQKHDSFLDKHGAALGAARSGLYSKSNFRPSIDQTDDALNLSQINWLWLRQLLRHEKLKWL